MNIAIYITFSSWSCLKRNSITSICGKTDYSVPVTPDSVSLKIVQGNLNTLFARCNRNVFIFADIIKEPVSRIDIRKEAVVIAEALRNHIFRIVLFYIFFRKSCNLKINIHINKEVRIFLKLLYSFIVNSEHWDALSILLNSSIINIREETVEPLFPVILPLFTGSICKGTKIKIRFYIA